MMMMMNTSLAGLFPSFEHLLLREVLTVATDGGAGLCFVVLVDEAAATPPESFPRSNWNSARYKAHPPNARHRHELSHRRMQVQESMPGRQGSEGQLKLSLS